MHNKYLSRDNNIDLLLILIYIYNIDILKICEFMLKLNMCFGGKDLPNEMIILNYKEKNWNFDYSKFKNSDSNKIIITNCFFELFKKIITLFLNKLKSTEKSKINTKEYNFLYMLW
jgi:hypothetical protein